MSACRWWWGRGLRKSWIAEFFTGEMDFSCARKWCLDYQVIRFDVAEWGGRDG